jgi:DNA-directed RNA polymerase specialized sigma24 family protein
MGKPAARGEGLAPFPTTRWSVVLCAGHAAEEQRRAALDALLRRYLPALRAHLLIAKVAPPGDVDDLLQGFIADKVVAQDLIAKVRRERGRFRTFVAVALDRYVLDQLRRQRSTLRSPAGEATVVPLDDNDPVDPSPSNHRAFNIAWAAEVVAEARRRMRAECEASGRDDVWAVFSGRVAEPAIDGAKPTPYSQLARQLTLESEAQAANLLVTGKRAFARAIRSVVADYVVDEGLVDEEMSSLIGGL